MKKLEDLIKSKIIFFLLPKKNNDKVFNSFTEIPIKDRYKESKKLKITKSKKEVTYDSPYEKKIIEDLDKCSFVKKIKTQSLVINYKSVTRDKKYYPDIQVLLDDGRIVLIEVKPFKEMVNKKNLLKHDALKKYCRKHRYGYAILDHDYYSFEDLKKEVISNTIQNKFISFVKRKKEVTFDDCNKFKKEYNITDKEICYIIYKNKKLIYQQHLIKYNKEDL